MASTKAQLAKDKGNVAFKAADYPSAIGHYSEAILADRKDPTFPLNRAAAYLRLGKNEDAERDCTTVVTLNASNVKGLFRRGQARLGLNKLTDAQDDFKEALRLEPANASVKQELKKLEELLTKSKSRQADKMPMAPAPISLPSTSVLPQRRRIPIEIVDPKAGNPKAISKTKSKAPLTRPAAPGEDDFMKPVSSRALAASPSVVPTKKSPPSQQPHTPIPPSTTPKPSSFRDAKQARENAKPSRAGGGIFRSTGEHTIVENGEKKNAKSTATTAPPSPAPANGAPETKPAAPNVQSTKPPMTLFDFVRSWESFESPKERWRFMNQIPPPALPSLFQNSLEPTLLASILNSFASVLSTSENSEDNDRVRMREYMASFTKVPRFRTVVLFMSKGEKGLAKEVWERLGVRNGGASWGISN